MMLCSPGYALLLVVSVVVTLTSAVIVSPLAHVSAWNNERRFSGEQTLPATTTSKAIS